VGLFLNTFGTAKINDSKGRAVKDSEIAEKIKKLFDLKPYAIVRRFGLNNPVFLRTASYGHFGRDCQVINEEVYYEVPGSNPKAVNNNGKKAWQKKVELFAWEKLDYVDKIRKEFKMKP
jgi:S-adenosylmethionine synthetase